MIYTYEYDNAYFGPAMPIVEMAISAVGKQNRLVLRALVDSGADATMIPIRHLHRNGLLSSVAHTTTL